MTESLPPALARLESLLARRFKRGRNRIAGWQPAPGGIRILVVPHYRLLAQAGLHTRILRGQRLLGDGSFRELSHLLECEPETISLDLPQRDLPLETIERVVARFAIAETSHRGVALFDIVDFSLGSAVEQVAQISSLDYSINIALELMGQMGLPLDLGRSSTGDGFYVWNRAKGFAQDTALAALAMLTLADNAVARQAQSPLVPRLRAAFTIGGHFSFHQIEGRAATGHDYIVGDATITLARLIAAARGEQILFGELVRPGEGAGAIDTPGFMSHLQELLDRLLGTRIRHRRVTDIRCYLTGERIAAERYEVSRYRIYDKHRRPHIVYNAKMTVHRGEAPPIYVGLQHADLAGFGERLAPHEGWRATG